MHLKHHEVHVMCDIQYLDARTYYSACRRLTSLTAVTGGAYILIYWSLVWFLQLQVTTDCWKSKSHSRIKLGDWTNTSGNSLI